MIAFVCDVCGVVVNDMIGVVSVVCTVFDC